MQRSYRYLDQQLQVHIVALGSGPGRLLVTASSDQIDTHGASTAQKPHHGFKKEADAEPADNFVSSRMVACANHKTRFETTERRSRMRRLHRAYGLNA